MIRTSGFTPKTPEPRQQAAPVHVEPPAPDVKASRQDQDGQPVSFRKMPSPAPRGQGLLSQVLARTRNAVGHSPAGTAQATGPDRVQPPPPREAPPAGTPVENSPVELSEQLQKRALAKKRAVRLFYLLCAVFFVGMLYGAVFANSGAEGLLKSLSSVNSSYLYERQSQSLMDGFVSALTASSLFLLLLFACGASMAGQPGVIAVLFLRGLGVGSYMGYLYLAYAAKGVFYSAVMILPGVLISTLALVLAGRESLRLSNRTFLAYYRGGTLRRKALALYLQKYLILFLLLAAAAAVDSAVGFVFSGAVTLG